MAVMTNKFKRNLIKELEEAEKYNYKVFLYLKELEKKNPKDLRLQEEIWNLCEADELVSTVEIELECLED